MLGSAQPSGPFRFLDFKCLFELNRYEIDLAELLQVWPEKNDCQRKLSCFGNCSKILMKGSAVWDEMTYHAYLGLFGHEK